MSSDLPPTLLPPNATEFERNLEAVIAARLQGIPAPTDQLWNPQTCPAELLPWLAWALSVDEWNSSWTEQQQRNAVAASIALHKQKGTVSAVKRIITQIFGVGDVIEHWEFNGAPHTFKIVSDGEIDDEPDYDQLIKLANSVKAARSTIVAVRLLRHIDQSLYFGGVAHTGTTQRVNHTLNPLAPPRQQYMGMVSHSGNVIQITHRIEPEAQHAQYSVAMFNHAATLITLHPIAPNPTASASPAYIGGYVQSSNTTTIQPGA